MKSIHCSKDLFRLRQGGEVGELRRTGWGHPVPPLAPQEEGARAVKVTGRTAKLTAVEVNPLKGIWPSRVKP